jgi:hypothetical protein
MRHLEMKIAVIGTGNVGSALGGSLVRARHQVTFTGRDGQKARDVAGQLGASWAPDPASAAADAEAVILAVPSAALEDVARALGSSADGKVVIDPTNRLKPDYSGLADDGGPSNAERIARLLPGSRVVKAFNTLFGSLQAQPATLGTTLDALYATDDDVASEAVSALASSIGFRPVRVGPLTAARELEALAWLNIRLQMLSGGDWRSTFVLVGCPPAAVTTPRVPVGV